MSCIPLNLYQSILTVLSSFAYANMRLALAFLLWNFDLKSQPGNDNPDSLKEYGLWEHRPMYVQVQERQ